MRRLATLSAIIFSASCILLAGCSSDNPVSQNPADKTDREWTSVQLTGLNFVDVVEDVNNPDRLLFSAIPQFEQGVTPQGGLVVSEDGGQTLTPIVEDQVFGPLSWSYGTPQKLLSVTGDYITDRWLAWSDDGGTSWQEFSGLRQLSLAGCGGFLLNPSNANDLILFGSGGFNTLLIYHSNDFGTSWAEISDALARDIIDLPQWRNSSTPDLLAITNSGRMIRSTDGGISWASFYDFSEYSLRSMTIVPGSSDYILVTSGSSVYLSDDGGSSFTSLGNLPAGAEAFSTSAADSDGTLYMSVKFTGNDGPYWEVYESDLSTLDWTQVGTQQFDYTPELRVITDGTLFALSYDTIYEY